MHFRRVGPREAVQRQISEEPSERLMPRLNPDVPATSRTPPTLLVQAEDDDVDGVTASLVYYAALANVHVPAELHRVGR